MSELMSDLAVDTRLWGRWEIEQLFDWMQEYLRAGYTKLPEKILITWEQRPYLLKMINDYGQPVIKIERLNLEDGIRSVEKVYTPFGQMKIEVVGYRSEHEA